MNILLTIAVVICGCSLISGRPFNSWYDDDDLEELFGGNIANTYDEDYDVDSVFDAELREILAGKTKSLSSNDDDDESMEATPAAVSSSTSEDDYVDNLMLKLFGSLPDDDESDADYKPTTQVTSDDDNDSDEKIEDEEDDDYTTAGSWQDLFKQDRDDSSEQEDPQHKDEKEAVTVFSAHLGFNPDSLLTVNLLSSDSDGHVQNYHYNTYDVLPPQPEPNAEVYQTKGDATETPELEQNQYDETVELVRPTQFKVTFSMAPQPQQADLLQKLSLSSANSELLSNQYSENILDFVAIHRNLKESLDMLQRHNEQLYEEFFDVAGDRSDYNGQLHKKIEGEMVGMLSKIDEVKGKIMEMQSVEQRLNYHLLLNALLKEIYSDTKDL